MHASGSRIQAKILRSEPKILRMLDHPNIIHCKEVVETHDELVRVCPHGDSVKFGGSGRREEGEGGIGGGRGGDDLG